MYDTRKHKNHYACHYAVPAVGAYIHVRVDDTKYKRDLYTLEKYSKKNETQQDTVESERNIAVSLRIKVVPALCEHPRNQLTTIPFTLHTGETGVEAKHMCSLAISETTSSPTPIPYMSNQTLEFTKSNPTLVVTLETLLPQCWATLATREDSMHGDSTAPKLRSTLRPPRPESRPHRQGYPESCRRPFCPPLASLPRCERPLAKTLPWCTRPVFPPAAVLPSH